MKIGLIGPTHPFRGGISHYTTLLYRALKKRHTVTFVSFKRQYPRFLFPGKTDIDPSRSYIKEEGVQRVLDSMNPASWLKAASILVRDNVDLVVIHWWVSFWAPQFLTISLCVKALGKTKLLFLCHNVVEHESGWIDKQLTRQVLRWGDYYVVHSTEDLDNLLQILPHANARKSFHPTYDVFNEGDFDPDHIKKKYGIEGDVLLFFGFVREYKGLKYLIEALPLVLAKIDITLLIVGEFWKDKSEYLDLIAGLGLENEVVIIDAYVPNEAIGHYFSSANLVVQPYTSATGSGVVQIAFGFNKPVVVTDVGCLSEVVEDGTTGYLVPPKSPEKLAEAIIKFFEGNQSGEFRDNIVRTNYKFSWDRMVEIIESFD